ncbi:MAG: hypothetical protein ACYCUG_13570 [Acidimicrobiales bacterium]
MTTQGIDPEFALALRDQLLATAAHDPRRRPRLSRLLAVAGAGVVLAGTGAAFAAGLFNPPGGTSDAPLGVAVAATRTGSATINLGTPPKAANDVSVILTCLTPGSFRFPGGEFTCTTGEMSLPAKDRQASTTVAVPADHRITVHTSPTASWSLRASYVHQTTTAWGTNAHGQTYGVINSHGIPDLVAVDNGKVAGYVKASDMACASGGDVTDPAQAVAWDKASATRDISIPVYESDGATIIGTFVIGGARGPGTHTVALSATHLPCARSHG